MVTKILNNPEFYSEIRVLLFIPLVTAKGPWRSSTYDPIARVCVTPNLEVLVRPSLRKNGGKGLSLTPVSPLQGVGFNA